MIELLLVSIPFIALLAVFVFWLGLICSAEFRDVVAGMKEGSFSVLHLMSAKGVGAIIFTGMLMGAGVMFPLYLFSDVYHETNTKLRVERNDLREENIRLTDDNNALLERLDGYENPREWTIEGSLRLPQEADLEFGNLQEARSFWLLGTWTGYGRRNRYAPYVTRMEPLQTASFRMARFTIEVKVPQHFGELTDEVELVRFEHKGGTDLGVDLFSEMPDFEYVSRGSAIVFDDPIDLYLFTGGADK